MFSNKKTCLLLAKVTKTSGSLNSLVIKLTTAIKATLPYKDEAGPLKTSILLILSRLIL